MLTHSQINFQMPQRPEEVLWIWYKPKTWWGRGKEKAAWDVLWNAAWKSSSPKYVKVRFPSPCVIEVFFHRNCGSVCNMQLSCCVFAVTKILCYSSLTSCTFSELLSLLGAKTLSWRFWQWAPEKPQSWEKNVRSVKGSSSCRLCRGERGAEPGNELRPTRSDKCPTRKYQN